MSYLEVFGVLTGVGVDVSKIFGVGAGALKRGAGVESESEKCDFAHLCCKEYKFYIKMMYSDCQYQVFA